MTCLLLCFNEIHSSYIERVLDPDILPLWLSAAVVGFGVFFAWRTLNAINDQVSEMRSAGEQTKKLICEASKQSEAVTISVNALIESERAWIHVHIPAHTPLSTFRPPPTLQWIWIRPIIKNEGRTMARITKTWAS